MPCSLCDSKEAWEELGVDFYELDRSAKLGCHFCSVIRDGVLEFSNGDDPGYVLISEQFETRQESRLGRRLPLIVRFTTAKEGVVTIAFYTTYR